MASVAPEISEDTMDAIIVASMLLHTQGEVLIPMTDSMAKRIIQDRLPKDSGWEVVDAKWNGPDLIEASILQTDPIKYVDIKVDIKV